MEEEVVRCILKQALEGLKSVIELCLSELVTDAPSYDSYFT